LRRAADGSVQLQFGSQSLLLPADQVARRSGLQRYPEGSITVGIRPEGLHHAPDAAPELSLEVTADVVEMLGPETLIHFVAPVQMASDADVRDRADTADEEESILATEGSTVMCARLVPPVRLLEGARIRLSVDTEHLYLFDQRGDAIR